jgi:hypothetical protein
MRRYQLDCDRKLHRALGGLRMLRRDEGRGFAGDPAPEDDPAPDPAPEPMGTVEPAGGPAAAPEVDAEAAVRPEAEGDSPAGLHSAFSLPPSAFPEEPGLPTPAVAVAAGEPAPADPVDPMPLEGGAPAPLDGDGAPPASHREPMLQNEPRRAPHGERIPRDEPTNPDAPDPIVQNEPGSPDGSDPISPDGPTGSGRIGDRRVPTVACALVIFAAAALSVAFAAPNRESSMTPARRDVTGPPDVPARVRAGFPATARRQPFPTRLRQVTVKTVPRPGAPGTRQTFATGQALSPPIPQMGHIAMVATPPPGSKSPDANRRDGQKPRQPAGAEGKARVAQGATKHAPTARAPVAPGEDAESLTARVAAWKEHLQPQNALEHYLAERVARAAWQLDRCDRAIAAMKERARAGRLAREAAETEVVEDLARQLFWHPLGPIALYPHFRGSLARPRISCPDDVHDPLDPARIVNRLEATYTGCRWLLDRWGDLRRLLEEGLHWQAPDRLRAIRLLGRQPIDALGDEQVLAIYLACDAMDPCAPSSLGDLGTETDGDELATFKERFAGRGADRKWPKTMGAGRAALLALIKQTVAPLGDLLAKHREQREFEEVMQPDLLAFDDSREGELARRHQLARASELQRAIATYHMARKASAGGTGRAKARGKRLRPADVNAGDPASCAAPRSIPPPALEGPSAAPLGDETNPDPGPAEAAESPESAPVRRAGWRSDTLRGGASGSQRPGDDANDAPR